MPVYYDSGILVAVGDLACRDLSFPCEKMLEPAGRKALGVGGGGRERQRCLHIGVGPLDRAHFPLALGARANAICTTARRLPTLPATMVR